jgi:hypothetical protein
MTGNEPAKALAKQAARKRPRKITYTPTIPQSFLKYAVKEVLVWDSQSVWETRHTGKTYSGRFKKNPGKFFFTNHRKLVCTCGHPKRIYGEPSM